MSLTKGLVFAERKHIGDTAPTTFEDTSRFGNDGIETAITKVQLPSGLWVSEFNGISSIVTIADNSSFDIKTQVTALIWANITDITLSHSTLISRYNTVGNLRDWVFTKSHGNGKIAVYFGDPANGSFEGNIITNDNILSNGIYFLIGFTFNVGTVIVYANGVAVGATVEAGAIPSLLYNPTVNTAVGAYANSTVLWTGNLVLSRIYNRALSPVEIADLFESERHLFGV